MSVYIKKNSDNQHLGCTEGAIPQRRTIRVRLAHPGQQLTGNLRRLANLITTMANTQTMAHLILCLACPKTS